MRFFMKKIGGGVVFFVGLLGGDRKKSKSGTGGVKNMFVGGCAV